MLTHKFHSTMSKLSRLMMMAAITAAASQQGMTDLSDLGTDRPVVRYKGEAPKCKTCVHYRTTTKCLTPMRMACDEYKRRKKK